MLTRKMVSIFMLLFFALVLCAEEVKKDYPIRPVPFKDFEAAEGFWKTRIDTNRNVTIPYAFKMCEETGRIDNFAVAGGLKEGKLQGYFFNDSDVFKIIEGAAYSLAVYPDAELEKYVEGLIAKIASAQEDDGYLYTARTIDPENPPEHSGKQRWSKLRYSHELYNVGHLYEAAAAWYHATGKRNLLDVAVKNADLVCSTFGPDKKRDTSGHEEVEIGLARLYNVTGNRKYLDMAKFFIDQRGHHEGRESYMDFRQDHKPFVEQDQAVGHAVSGAYLYSGAADVAALTDDKGYVDALDRIWEDAVSKKLYITGAAAASGEKFGPAYELPNLKGYNETCAAIAMAMWNQRMFLLHGDAKYIDLLERSLYNGTISGVSLQGNSFFYANPLSSDGVYKFTNKKLCTRADWFNCSCCPSNIARFIPSVAGYVYAQKDDIIYVNLYSPGTGKIELADNTVLLKQETLYPWEGNVRITVAPAKEGKFSVYLRLPGWATGRPVPGNLHRYALQLSSDITLAVNGEKIQLRLDKMPSDGYAKIKRVWKKGDVIELGLPMQVQRVVCNEKVTENRGKVALERGPVVYCVEGIDNGGKVSDISVSDDDTFEVVYQKDLLGGVNTIKAKNSGLLAIPYYAWNHRGQGEMAVWLARANKPLTSSKLLFLNADSFRHHVDKLNATEPENIINYISNAESWDWIKANAPLFECPDKDFEEIYYFRWWTFRKHIKKTEDGFVLTEFAAPVGHSGKHNTISCALGHQIYEGRWLRDGRYMDEYSAFWYRGNNGQMQPHFRRYSNWTADAMYNRYLVNKDSQFLVGLLDAMIANFEGWQKDCGLDNGLLWQYDVWDGMEESISGSRTEKNVRPTINSYMYADAMAISRIAMLAGKTDIAKDYQNKAEKIKSLVEKMLWDKDAEFFKVLHLSGKFADVREELGLIPWYFNLPQAGKGYEKAWLQILDPQGFKSPMGLMTAERRHPAFRSHGVGTCEWDGAVWPFATTQSLVGLANVLRNYKQDYVAKKDYFEALMTFAGSHDLDGRPFIGEYLDENTGQWLTPVTDRSRYYNHSAFCDLVISGLCGLVPREDDTVEVSPLLPADAWDWFCLDNVPYHGKTLTIVWDRTGEKYAKGKGLRIFADGIEIGKSEKIGMVTANLH